VGTGVGDQVAVGDGLGGGGSIVGTSLGAIVAIGPGVGIGVQVGSGDGVHVGSGDGVQVGACDGTGFGVGVPGIEASITNAPLTDAPPIVACDS
jgi:hypothetical protein